MESLIKTIRDEWSGRGSFFGRGNWSECMLSVSETATGAHILIVGAPALYKSILLDRFADGIPIWVTGLIWFLSGGLTLSGIGLYCLGYRTSEGYYSERLLRFLGALGSIYVWLVAGLLLAPSPFMYLYFAAAIGAMRVTRIVWRN